MDTIQPQEVIITTPTSHDVLCGSGSQVNGHTGNQLFRKTLRARHAMYANAITKPQKMRVTKLVFDELVHAGARFLKKDPIFDRWYLVGAKGARDKISHCLRRMQPPGEEPDEEQPGAAPEVAEAAAESPRIERVPSSDEIAPVVVKSADTTKAVSKKQVQSNKNSPQSNGASKKSASSPQSINKQDWSSTNDNATAAPTAVMSHGIAKRVQFHNNVLFNAYPTLSSLNDQYLIAKARGLVLDQARMMNLQRETPRPPPQEQRPSLIGSTLSILHQPSHREVPVADIQPSGQRISSLETWVKQHARVGGNGVALSQIAGAKPMRKLGAKDNLVLSGGKLLPSSAASMQALMASKKSALQICEALSKSNSL